MTREMSPPVSRRVLFAFSLMFAVAAALLGGGVIGKPATAAQGDGSFVLCKQYWATGPSIKVTDVTFRFDIEFNLKGDAGPEPVAVEIVTFESGEDCSEPILIPDGAEVTVSETLPPGWLNTPTYPRSVLTVGDSDDPLRTDSTSATFDGRRCIEQACVLTFKNKKDETGEQVVPPLIDPFRGTLHVCKAFLDNGDAFQVEPTQFTFEWTDKFSSFEFPIGPFIPEGVTGCSGFSVIDVYPGDTVALRELPTSSFADTPGFPTVELEGPNGFAARTGTSVTVDLTRCAESGSGAFSPSLIDGQGTFECRVTFMNRSVAAGETGSIRVQKVTREARDGELFETDHHAGWTFTLRSNDCETIETGVTDADGFIQWDDLGLCPDYTVTEDTENVPFEGYEPVTGPVISNIQPGLFEITDVVLINERVPGSEPCGDCTEPTPDPVVEEPSQDPVVEEPVTGPVVEDPAAAPVLVDPEPTPGVVMPEPSPEPPTAPEPPAQESPTAEPTAAAPVPEETVAGEITPGPQPTPLAPSTGSGLVESNGGRLAISAGLAALSLAFFLGGVGLRRKE